MPRLPCRDPEFGERHRRGSLRSDSPVDRMVGRQMPVRRHERNRVGSRWPLREGGGPDGDRDEGAEGDPRPEVDHR